MLSGNTIFPSEISDGILISLREEHSLNASLLIFFTDVGISTNFNDEHEKKVQRPISLIRGGILILSSFVQKEKHPSPISIIEDGISIDSSNLQHLKAHVRIIFTVFGIIICLIGLYSKDDIPITFK